MSTESTPGGFERFEHYRIGMEYVVPLVRHLHKEIGVDVVNNALKSWSREKTKIAESRETTEGDLNEIKAIHQSHDEYGLDQDVIEDTDEKYSVNVTRCRFAEMMEEMGARDLGPLLICNHDFSGTLEMGLHLQRTQTIMKGCSHCNFRYTHR